MQEKQMDYFFPELLCVTQVGCDLRAVSISKVSPELEYNMALVCDSKMRSVYEFLVAFQIGIDF
jgi:hypothetical protein